MPIKAWGRAPHEAVVVEPSRRRVYLTEDASKPTGLALPLERSPADARIAHQLGVPTTVSWKPSPCSRTTAACCPTWLM
ncbi:MAG: hypothetical protein U0R78_09755 [Nocardioidaceae bacterium]